MITIVFGTAIYIRYIGLEMQKFLDVWTGISQDLMSRPHVALIAPIVLLVGTDWYILLRYKLNVQV